MSAPAIAPESCQLFDKEGHALSELRQFTKFLATRRPVPEELEHLGNFALRQGRKRNSLGKPIAQ